MFTIQSEGHPSQVTHTITAINAQFASVILETALRHELYVETDDSDACRLVIFYIADDYLDSIIIEARDAYDKATLPIAA